MPDRDYTVFYCEMADDDGDVWRSSGRIKAKSEPGAIEALRDNDPDLKGNADVRYFAIAGFRPRKMIREIIERFTLGYADDDQPKPDAQEAMPT